MQNFWKDMPWYAKLASVGVLVLAYIAILSARAVPAAIETLSAQFEAHAQASSIARTEEAFSSTIQKEKTEEQLRLLRSICVSLAIMSKTDQTKCF